MRTDDFLTDYERVLREAAGRRPRRAPAPRRIARASVALAALAAVVAAVILVPGRGGAGPATDERPVPTATASPPVVATPTPGDDPYRGAPDSQIVAATAPIPGSQDVAGILTYRSAGGKACLAAGYVVDARVGRYGRDGRFTPLDAADAPGSCGDIRENLADFGGVVLGRNDVVPGTSRRAQAIVHGLVASRSTRVTVTWRDGERARARVAPTRAPEDLDGATGAFVLAGRPGVELRGATVELTAPDGTVLHRFEL
ncbi:hypothetical protein C8N24_4147 [Solirubrobacter pauli]|uniref:Uncharacterized protein n=1 Tax=Solirubrobacter pauli TaxID=166793 RepID=A0A660KWP3_9ACTN|nr:hypothetical protein [Solirubrobacter pauli]RKQ86137.1 hypothetical protein C8N24_4147 [Solirubrobacter pauli]